MKTLEEIERDTKEKVSNYKQKFLEQSNFPPFRGVRSSKEDYLPAFRHTAFLIFIRAKFLFMGMLDEIDRKNYFAAFALLKAYWETVAAMGYFTLKIEKLIQDKDFDNIVAISRKIAMGGKKFPTKEMVAKKGDVPEDFLQPNLLTMMEKIDKDFEKFSQDNDPNKERTSFGNEYNVFIAEAGHPTFLGLFPGARKLADGSLLPDINRSGDEEDEKTILNYISLSSIYFFHYWETCMKLGSQK